VGIIRAQRFIAEERRLKESDWEYDSSDPVSPVPIKAHLDEGEDSKRVAASTKQQEPPKKRTKEEYLEQKALSKKIMNAPKRIAKLQEMIEEKEGLVAQLEEDMIVSGADLPRLMELTSRVDKLKPEIQKLYEEWEELEELVATHSKD